MATGRTKGAAAGKGGRGSGAPKGRATGSGGAKKASGKAAPGGARKASQKRPAAGGDKAGTATWLMRTVILLGAIAALRLAVNALDLVPVHFDEAQYWAYGQELAWGYFSKPPGVGFVIRVTTDLGGDSLFWLRIGSVLAHLAIALGIGAVAARLFDGRTGFWAAAGYSLAPGVSASAMIMSTDPVLMVAWAAALYALVRAMESRAFHWWALMGAAIGLGMLAKYTMLGFAAGALGYALFSAETRDWRRDLAGLLTAAAVALVVFAPNLLWNAENSFATVTHVAEDADPGKGYFNPLKLAEFTGAQLGVIGPVFFLAMIAALATAGRWRGDWRMRLLAWQTWAVLGGIIALSFATRAQPNWAAPAYVAGSILAARWLLDGGFLRGLRAQLWIGVAAALVLWSAAALYAVRPLDLPRNFDPFKKMRLSEPFCELALGAMAEEGAQALLSNDRRRLSECMFQGGLTWDEIAVWNPKLNPQNHHELVATLRPGDTRPMLIAVIEGAEEIASAFEEAREIDAGRFATHADREIPYQLWFVEGFRAYPR